MVNSLSKNKKSDNSQQLIIGNILQKIGFCYGEEANLFQVNKDLYLETYCGWDFYSSKNEIVLDAICDNILYFYPLDIENVKAKDILNLAKNTIAKKMS